MPKTTTETSKIQVDTVDNTTMATQAANQPAEAPKKSPKKEKYDFAKAGEKFAQYFDLNMQE